MVVITVRDPSSAFPFPYTFPCRCSSSSFWLYVHLAVTRRSLLCSTSCGQSFLLFSMRTFEFVWVVFYINILIIRCFLMQVEPYEDTPYIQGAVNMVLRLRWDRFFFFQMISSFVPWCLSNAWNHILIFLQSWLNISVFPGSKSRNTKPIYQI